MQVRMKFGMVHWSVNILVIAVGLKKSHILIFSKYKFKIASLANVKSCVTVGPIP